MFDEDRNSENMLVKEPQLEILYYSQKTKEKKKDTLNVLSLFSGCGGMDLGFEGGFSVLKSSVNETLNPNFIEKNLKNGFVQLRKTKFKTVFANDILPDARNAWVNFFTKRGHNAEDFYQDSIVDLVKMYRSGTNVFPDDVDVVTGGFPCQDYSVARSKKNEQGIEGKKGVLFWEIIRATRITKPKYLILENVDRLLKAPSKQRGRDFAIMLTAFNNLGYSVEWRVINAAEYGRSQRRRRVFFFVFRNDTEYAKKLDGTFEQGNEVFQENKYDQYIYKSGLFATFAATLG